MDDSEHDYDSGPVDLDACGDRVIERIREDGAVLRAEELRQLAVRVRDEALARERAALDARWLWWRLAEGTRVHTMFGKALVRGHIAGPVFLDAFGERRVPVQWIVGQIPRAPGDPGCVAWTEPNVRVAVPEIAPET